MKKTKLLGLIIIFICVILCLMPLIFSKYKAITPKSAKKAIDYYLTLDKSFDTSYENAIEEIVGSNSVPSARSASGYSIIFWKITDGGYLVLNGNDKTLEYFDEVPDKWLETYNEFRMLELRGFIKLYVPIIMAATFWIIFAFLTRHLTKKVTKSELENARKRNIITFSIIFIVMNLFVFYEIKSFLDILFINTVAVAPAYFETDRLIAKNETGAIKNIRSVIVGFFFSAILFLFMIYIITYILGESNGLFDSGTHGDLVWIFAFYLFIPPIALLVLSLVILIWKAIASSASPVRKFKLKIK